jgi:hypothetical protein
MYFCSGQPMHFCSGVDRYLESNFLIVQQAVIAAARSRPSDPSGSGPSPSDPNRLFGSAPSHLPLANRNERGQLSFFLAQLLKQHFPFWFFRHCNEHRAVVLDVEPREHNVLIIHGAFPTG